MGPGGERRTRHARHDDIRQDHIDRQLRVLKKPNRLVPVRGRHDLVTSAGQDPVDDIPDRGLFVGHQHSDGGFHRPDLVNRWRIGPNRGGQHDGDGGTRARFGSEPCTSAGLRGEPADDRQPESRRRVSAFRGEERLEGTFRGTRVHAGPCVGHAKRDIAAGEQFG